MSLAATPVREAFVQFYCKLRLQRTSKTPNNSEKIHLFTLRLERNRRIATYNELSQSHVNRRRTFLWSMGFHVLPALEDRRFLRLLRVLLRATTEISRWCKLCTLNGRTKSIIMRKRSRNVSEAQWSKNVSDGAMGWWCFDAFLTGVWGRKWTKLIDVACLFNSLYFYGENCITTTAPLWRTQIEEFPVRMVRKNIYSYP